jgi:Dyp-type peroxidase family
VRLPWSRYQVDQQDLQGNVLASYGKRFSDAVYLFLRVEDEGLGRSWIGELVPDVTTAVPWQAPPPHTVNVSFTSDGLRALGLPEALLETFPQEFREGMGTEERADMLGDVGPSAPQRWEAGLAPGEPHAVLTLFGLGPELLEAERQRRIERIRQPGSGLSLLHELPAALLSHPGIGIGREHFGFADGFAQPAIRGNAGPYDRNGGGTLKRFGRWANVAPGEFVLGYRAEDGTIATAPEAPVRRSGTFTVIRKLQQDVAGFTNYLKRESGGNGARAEWLAARIVGRWRDGTPVEISPDVSDPSLARDTEPGGKINDFHYTDDGEGLRCPLGAHIRRANPRDTFGWQGRLTKRHRIIRRGMPYGAPPKNPAEPDGQPRGLVFVCHQSSISRQFEVIQQRWMGDGDAFWLGPEKDLLTMGGHGEGMTIARRPPIFLEKPPHFVVNKGGGYFFTPGIDALRTIAAGGWV